jgi:hypothetical protein
LNNIIPSDLNNLSGLSNTISSMFGEGITNLNTHDFIENEFKEQLLIESFIFNNTIKEC